MGFEERRASLNARVQKAALSFPLQWQTLIERECACLGRHGASRAGRQGLRRGCLGHSALTSCLSGTVKALYEPAYDLLQGELGCWCLFLQMFQDPAFTFFLYITAWPGS